jgi:hypothetical protein
VPLDLYILLSAVRADALSSRSQYLRGLIGQERRGDRTCRRTTGEADLEEPPATLCARSTMSGDSACQLSFTTGKVVPLCDADVYDSSELNDSCRLGFDCWAEVEGGVSYAAYRSALASFFIGTCGLELAEAARMDLLAADRSFFLACVCISTMPRKSGSCIDRSVEQ